MAEYPQFEANTKNENPDGTQQSTPDTVNSINS